MMYETGKGSYTAPERKVALVHRVIMPDKDYPKEYAILLTDRRSIFILQRKTRSSFVLRGEMRYGTALVSDVQPKTLEACEKPRLEKQFFVITLWTRSRFFERSFLRQSCSRSIRNRAHVP